MQARRHHLSKGSLRTFTCNILQARASLALSGLQEQFALAPCTRSSAEHVSYLWLWHWPTQCPPACVLLIQRTGPFRSN